MSKRRLPADDDGRVIAGMDQVDRIERGEPPQHPTKILQASLASQNLPPPPPPAPPVEQSITADMLNNSSPVPAAAPADAPAPAPAAAPATPPAN